MLTAPIVIVVLAGAWLILGGLGAGAPSIVGALSAAERERIEREQIETARGIVANVHVPTTAAQVNRGIAIGSLVGGSLAWVPAVAAIPAIGPIAAGVGAGVAWILSVTGNDTLSVRKDFAKQLGFCGLENGRQGWIGHIETCPGLFPALRQLGRDDLVNVAQNVIGKQDDRANEAWMFEVVRAFLDAGWVVAQ